MGNSPSPSTTCAGRGMMGSELVPWARTIRAGLSRDRASKENTMKTARRAFFIVFSLLALSLLSPARIVRAQGTSSLPIMPLPAHVVEGEGEFPIDGNFGIALKGYKEPRLERARQRFLDTL